MFPADYFAPRFFPASYFPNGGTGIVTCPIRDSDVFIDIKARVEALGLFDIVERHAPSADMRVSGETRAAFFVEPLRGKEEDGGCGDAYGNEDEELIITTFFRAWIAVRDDDPDRRLDRLGMLLNAVKNAIDGKSLANDGSQGSGTYAYLTGIQSWTYLKPDGPDQALECIGSFAYDVPGYANHLADDNFDYTG